MVSRLPFHTLLYPYAVLSTGLNISCAYQAAGWLENAGYSGVINMEGCFSAWARDESLPVEA